MQRGLSGWGGSRLHRRLVAVVGEGRGLWEEAGEGRTSDAAQLEMVAPVKLSEEEER